jgi:single-strand DNA-binding protein
MAGSVNKVILIGNLGADPEVRAANDGRKIVNLRIATTERWTAKDGQKKEATSWHAVSVFAEPLAKVAEAYLRKGSKVYVEGSLRTRKYTAKDGSERYVTEVVLQGFGSALVLLDGAGSKGDEAGSAEDPGSYAKAKGKPYQPQTQTLDEVPF